MLADSMSYSKMKRILKALLKDTINEFAKPFDIIKPEYYFIIGSCMPKDNMLLDVKDNKYFPTKLDKLINSDYNIKYLLKEKDIKLDVVQFNTVLIDIFNELFKRQKNGNTIFMQHKRLDCYTMFKIIKSIYGKANCINLDKTMYSDKKIPLVAVNDLIDKYVHNKTTLQKTQDFKNAYEEVKFYLKNKDLI